MSPEAITARLGKDITQAAVDESVMRMLTPMFSVGVMDAHDADNSLRRITASVCWSGR